MSPPILVFSVVYGWPASVPSAPSPQLHRPPSRSIPSVKGIDFILLTKVLVRAPIFTRPSQANHSHSSTVTHTFMSPGPDMPPLSISDNYSSISEGSHIALLGHMPA
jgi:hypothetical protein